MIAKEGSVIKSRQNVYVFSYNSFNVKVTHWKESYRIGLGKGCNCWDIQVTVFENNKYFKRLWVINSQEYSTEVDYRLGNSFHGSCTLCYKTSMVDYGEKYNSVTIGYDYQHYGDERFSELEEINDELLEDVNEIFLFFSDGKAAVR